MAELEEHTHVFILRFWCEPREIEGANSEWRATIEHVSSGHRHHVRHLGEVEPLIAGYLGEQSTRWNRRGAFKRWLIEWKRR
jgi:hypothetical protein